MVNSRWFECPGICRDFPFGYFFIVAWWFLNLTVSKSSCTVLHTQIRVCLIYGWFKGFLCMRVCCDYTFDHLIWSLAVTACTAVSPLALPPFSLLPLLRDGEAGTSATSCLRVIYLFFTCSLPWCVSSFCLNHLYLWHLRDTVA